MKSTLIIHPKDESTSFLKQIYTNKNVSVVTGEVTKTTLQNMILGYDRIIMMGHGSSDGLLAVDQFDTDSSHIIDDSFIDVLKRKENSIYIWCHADQFVRKFNLKGFYTGMFISEVSEANYLGLTGTKQVEVNESNFYFSNLVSQYMAYSLENMFVKVKEHYGMLSELNTVANYNFNRLYINS